MQPFIVFDDADLDKAVESALASKFRNAGQTCVCANRLYVQDGVYERFAEKLQQAVSKLHLGDGLQPDVTTGPLIDEKAVAKVQEHIADALDKGARIIAAASLTLWAVTSSSPPSWWMCLITRRSPKKKPSARWLRCFVLKTKLTSSLRPTTPSLVWPPISTPVI